MHLLKRAATPLLVTPAGFSLARCHVRTLLLQLSCCLQSGKKPSPVIIRGSCQPNKAPFQSNLALASHWCIIPHPDKAHKGGEVDPSRGARFYSSHRTHVTLPPSPQALLMVWEVGPPLQSMQVQGYAPAILIVAGMYSKALMQATKQISETAPLTFVPNNSRLMLPVARLWQAYLQVQQRQIVGSTTATIVCLDDTEPKLHTLNLGDSAYLLLRKSGREYTVQNYSLEQQHYFNCPYQLGTGCDDTPDDAKCVDVEIKEGDLIILMTGGICIVVTMLQMG